MRAILHGQAQALGGRRARAPGGARRGGGGRGGAAGPGRRSATPSAWTWRPGATGCGWRQDDELYEEIDDGSLGDVDLVLSFLFWKRIRPPLIDAARVALPELPPRPAAGHARPRRLQRRDPRGLRGVGGVGALRGRGVRHRRPRARRPVPDRPRARRRRCRSTSAARSGCWRVFRDVIDTALAGEELPREPQGEGRYVTREEFEALRRVGPDDPPELDGRGGSGRSGTRRTTARRSRWAGGPSRSWTASAARGRRPTGRRGSATRAGLPVSRVSCSHGPTSRAPAAPRTPPRALLHVLRRTRWSGAARSCGEPAPDEARFCMSCGSALEAARRRAPRARGAARAARGAPPGDGAVRRPVRLHGRGRADGPRGGEVAGGPLAAAPGRRGRSASAAPWTSTSATT